MLSKFLTFVFIVTLVGCESKEYKKEENKNVDIVSELNEGDTDSVIQKLGSKENISPRSRYYLASALSQKGGIDVFSLYSILEMQLFRKNALEWSDLSKEKNPYLKFMKSQEGVDFDKRLKKREARWNEKLPKILVKHNIKLKKPTAQELSNEYFKVSEENFKIADEFYKKQYEEVIKLPYDTELRMEKWYEVMDGSINNKEVPEGTWELSNYYTDMIMVETMKHNYLYPEERASGGFSNIQWEMLYMNVLWNTYESIPLMKQMPTLDNSQQEFVSQALDQYKILIDDKEFRDVALKNIVVLGGVSLLSIYKNSFDLDEINSMQDLMCTFEPITLTENYGLIRKRILFLAATAEQVGSDAIIKEYEEKMKELKTSMPEELSVEQKEEFLAKVEKFQLDSCFNTF